MCEWSAKCGTPVQKYFVWDWWLNDLCTGIPVIDPGLIPNGCLSHALYFFRPVFREHVTV